MINVLLRCGALELNVDYLEPSYIKGTMTDGKYEESPPTPMHLILFPNQPRDNIDMDTTRMMVKNVLSDHYLVKPDKELVKTTLNSVGKATNMYQPGEEK